MNGSPTPALTITELTRRIKTLLENKFPNVWVEGEISNASLASSGHAYFTLKDAAAQISAVMFRNAAARLTFKLADGVKVIAFGDVSVYEKRGQYQLIVTQLLPQGVGALQLAFEELKRRLAAEGLFDPARKKPIPTLPQRIGLVTSPQGAAIRDFLNIIGRRFPNIHIVINPVCVQGPSAAGEIAAALDEFNALHTSGALPLDVVILTRGGGSLEDLWAFNEEPVARAIARSQIPTISAVGHEIDFTIADFVADLRAPTPSAAAELVVKAKDDFVRQIGHCQQRLLKDLRLRVSEARQRFQALASSYVFRQPVELIRQYQQQVDDLSRRLGQVVLGARLTKQAQFAAAAGRFQLVSPHARLRGSRQRLALAAQRLDLGFDQTWQAVVRRLKTTHDKLELLSPHATLQRGYSITRLLATGKIVRSVAEVGPGAALATKVADGEFKSTASE